MRKLFSFHHERVQNPNGRILKRKAARAIILRNDEILLLFTKRYNDYSFPGGGLNPEENIVEGLMREVKEETGASNLVVLQEYGHVDELRPHHDPGFDGVHMISYFYLCRVDGDLGFTQMESYEINNGMAPRWISVWDAIRHNRDVISKKDTTLGWSIERETRVLELVAQEVLK